MKKLMVVLAITLAGCSSSNVPEIRQNANKVFEDAGFKVVGYEGYQSGAFETYGGCVWYIVERNGVTYHGCVSKWGDEYHIYNLKALDAIGSQ